MKNSIHKALFIFITLLSCNKEGSEKPLSLASSWKETDYYYSIGGPVQWHKTEFSKEEIIQFKEENVFSSSVYKNLNRYIMEPLAANNSANFKLYEEGKTDTVRLIAYNITPNTMDVGFLGCIEGCGKRFARLK